MTLTDHDLADGATTGPGPAVVMTRVLHGRPDRRNLTAPPRHRLC